jgi:hypothetical protein
VVPREYRAAGCPPASWFIDDLMRHMGRRYYVGLLTAAALHGAGHQQPMAFQVMADSAERDIEVGRVRIDFHMSSVFDGAATEPMQTETGTMLLARGASRDLFDARELLARDTFDRDKLRLAFVVYGGINRVDWRTVSASAVTTTASDVKRQLLPKLRQDIRPADGDVERWTSALIDETRALLGAVLPLTEDEARFLERLNGDGEIEAALLTTDSELQRRIEASPGLQWKALNVKKHAGLDE